MLLDFLQAQGGPRPTAPTGESIVVSDRDPADFTARITGERLGDTAVPLVPEAALRGGEAATGTQLHPFLADGDKAVPTLLTTDFPVTAEGQFTAIGLAPPAKSPDGRALPGQPLTLTGIGGAPNAPRAALGAPTAEAPTNLAAPQLPTARAGAPDLKATEFDGKVTTGIADPVVRVAPSVPPAAALSEVTAALREQPVRPEAAPTARGLEISGALADVKTGAGELAPRPFSITTGKPLTTVEGPVFTTIEGRPVQTLTGEVLTVRPAAAPQNATRPEAFQQVADLIRIQSTDQRLNLRLDPPELGKVGIDLTFDNHRLVTATLSAESADTVSLLRRSLDSLQRELVDAGFEGVNIEFTDQPQDERAAESSPWSEITRQSAPPGISTSVAPNAYTNIVTAERIDARF